MFFFQFQSGGDKLTKKGSFKDDDITSPRRVRYVDMLHITMFPFGKALKF